MSANNSLSEAKGKCLDNEHETPLMYVSSSSTQVRQTCVYQRSGIPSEHDERESHRSHQGPSTCVSQLHEVHSQASIQSEHVLRNTGNTQAISSLMSGLQLSEKDDSRDKNNSTSSGVFPSRNGTPMEYRPQPISDSVPNSDRVQSMLGQPLFPITTRSDEVHDNVPIHTVTSEQSLSTNLYSVSQSIDRVASHESITANVLNDTSSLLSEQNESGRLQIQEIDGESGHAIQQLPRCSVVTLTTLPGSTYQISNQFGMTSTDGSGVSTCQMSDEYQNRNDSLIKPEIVSGSTSQTSAQLLSLANQTDRYEVNIPPNFIHNTHMPMRMPPSNFGVQCVNEDVKRIFHSLIPHVNSGKFNLFFSQVSTYQQDMTRDYDVRFIVRYLESCVYMYQNKADKCREAVSDALNIVPRTSSPNKFKVDILAIQSWLQLKRGRLDHVDDTLMGALQTHYQDREITSGKAAGWIHIQDARLDQSKMTGRHDDAILRSQSIKSLVFSLEQFEQEIDKNGLTGEGIYAYIFAALKLVSILLFCDEGMKLVRGELSKDEHVQVLELLVQILASNKENLDMHMTNLRVALADYYLKFGSLDSAKAYVIDALTVAHDPEAKRYCQARFDFIMERTNDENYTHHPSCFEKHLPPHFENLNEENCLKIRHLLIRLLRFLKYKVPLGNTADNSRDYKYMWENSVIPGTSLRDNKFAKENLMSQSSVSTLYQHESNRTPVTSDVQADVVSRANESTSQNEMGASSLEKNVNQGPSLSQHEIVHKPQNNFQSVSSQFSLDQSLHPEFNTSSQNQRQPAYKSTASSQQSSLSEPLQTTTSTEAFSNGMSSYSDEQNSFSLHYPMPNNQQFIPRPPPKSTYQYSYDSSKSQNPCSTTFPTGHYCEAVDYQHYNQLLASQQNSGINMSQQYQPPHFSAEKGSPADMNFSLPQQQLQTEPPHQQPIQCAQPYAANTQNINSPQSQQASALKLPPPQKEDPSYFNKQTFVQSSSQKHNPQNNHVHGGQQHSSQLHQHVIYPPSFKNQYPFQSQEQNFSAQPAVQMFHNHSQVNASPQQLTLQSQASLQNLSSQPGQDTWQPSPTMQQLHQGQYPLGVPAPSPVPPQFITCHQMTGSVQSPPAQQIPAHFMPLSPSNVVNSLSPQAQPNEIIQPLIYPNVRQSPTPPRVPNALQSQPASVPNAFQTPSHQQQPNALQSTSGPQQPYALQSTFHHQQPTALQSQPSYLKPNAVHLQNPVQPVMQVQHQIITQHAAHLPPPGQSEFLQGPQPEICSLQQYSQPIYSGQEPFDRALHFPIQQQHNHSSMQAAVPQTNLANEQYSHYTNTPQNHAQSWQEHQINSPPP